MSLKRLVKIAVGGAFTCIGTGLFFGKKIDNRLKEADYYKTAMTIIKTNKAVVDLLGEPISDEAIDLGNTSNRVTEISANLQVGVRGPKSSGVAYISAERMTAKEKWILSRIEMTFKKEPNRKLVVHNNSNR